MPTALWGPPSDEPEEEGKAWFTDGLGQYVGRSERWMVAVLTVLASLRGWGLERECRMKVLPVSSDLGDILNRPLWVEREIALG